MHVTVAVLTFRRNDDLRAVLPQLVAQVRDLRAQEPDVDGADVVVVDNDPAAGARAIGEAAVADTGDGVTVRYLHEPTPGIPAARNRALDAADPAGLLVFIDDDERPEPGWLVHLVRTWRTSGAAAVAGAVTSDLGPDVDPWLTAGGYFRRAHRAGLPTGTVVTSAATNNLLLDMRALTRHRLRFDTTLGLAGGEDSLLTGRLTRAGERIVWCAEARVVDCVPAHRLTRSSVVRRVYGTSNASVGVGLRLAGAGRERLVLRARYAATGVARLVAGAGQTAAGTLVRSATWQATGVRRVARGAGALSAVTGTRFEEYRR